MQYHAFVIKYAEIGVKGKNRYMFEDALVKQIKRVLAKCDGTFSISKVAGRVYVEAEGFDFDETVSALDAMIERYKAVNQTIRSVVSETDMTDYDSEILEFWPE